MGKLDRRSWLRLTLASAFLLGNKQTFAAAVSGPGGNNKQVFGILNPWPGRGRRQALSAPDPGPDRGREPASPAPDPWPARGRGSASALVGTVKLLFAFVSDRGAAPWTSATRNPVVWKIDAALRWLEEQAGGFGQALHIAHDCVPIAVPAFTLSSHIDADDYRAGPHHAAWQDEITRQIVPGPSPLAERWDAIFAGCGLPLGPDDKSAMLFVVRRYVPSVAFPFTPDQDPSMRRERGIIYDNGGAGMQRYLDSLIAHEILHLFGAVDLAPDKTPPILESQRAHLDPDDVMAVPTQRPLRDYRISELTAYLVGWRDTAPAWFTDGAELPTRR